MELRIKNVLLKIPLAFYYGILLVSKIILEYKNFSLSPDIAQQLHSLHSLTHGDGITIRFLDAEVINYYPYNYNSSGLALLLFPINIFLDNTIHSAFILCVVNVFCFALFLKKSNELLQSPAYLERIILLFFVFAVSPFVYHWPADALSMTTCLWGFYFSIKHMLLKKKYLFALSVFFMSLSYLIKYSYLPFIFVPLISKLIADGGIAKDKFVQLIKSFILTISFIIVTFCINYFFVGQRSEDFNFDGKIYFHHLLETDGILFHLGNYEQIIENGLKQISGMGFRFSFLSAVVTVAAIVLLIGMGCKHLRKDIDANHSGMLVLSTIVGTVLIVSFLGLLSVINPPIIVDDKLWTYVSNTRYFSPVIILGYLSILFFFYYCLPWRLNVLVYSMFLLLNLVSFRSLISVGNYGNSFAKYQRIQNQYHLKKLLAQPGTVIYFDSLTKNTPVYFTLLASGLLMEPFDSDFSQKKTGRVYPYRLSMGSKNKISLTPMKHF